ncbi:hypothetical protein H072_2955 [Dactylellina haptotyla CBS 200.50]|uniref:Thioredoxin domain-containing protein n=1 Tax=Dactylellina haptotyla (strain CBS 200.50) TaxID=1284197 RepID=S8BUB9_DACHA|nr:hypothetical protein H072_2955 [Dactylellina haptotyla CBS 200.50]
MSTAVVEISSETHLKDVMSKNSVVVIDFFATWCGPCKAIAPIYSKFAAELSQPGKIAFIKVDTDKHQGIAQAHQISAMPTFLVFQGGNETHRIRGADIPKLTSALKELISIAGGGGGGSSSSSSASWTGAEIPRGYRVINSEIELKGLDCMNWKSELGSIRTLFDGSEPVTKPGSSTTKGKGKDTSAGGADWMESDTDEQLMLFIPFSAVVKVFQIQITSLPPDVGEDEEADDETPTRPKTIKLYSNNAHILGFDEAEQKPMLQEIELKEEDWKNGTATIDTRFVKFQAVSTLTIFVVDAENGAESVRIDRIRIIGESGEKRDQGKLEKIGDDQ